MNARVFAVLYFGFWAATAAAAVYFASHTGHSLWLAAASAFLLFIFVNGSLAYVLKARKLRREGKRPPSYLVYLFFPTGVRQTVSVPRPLRVLLGIVILVSGALLVIASGMTLFSELSRMPHPIAAIAALILLAGLGTLFTYIGFRLIIVKNGEPLLKRRKNTSSHINAA